MPLSFASSSRIVRLSDRRKGFLQVLLPEFTLRRSRGNLSLSVTIRDDLYSLTDDGGKREFFSTVREHEPAGRAELQCRIKDFLADPDNLGRRFDCREQPFRYANGGLLPVIRLNGEDYFALFYREIFPIGWNIANGSSDSLEEMLAPQRIILREFGEEVFAIDHSNRLLYTYDPADHALPPSYQEESLRRWQERMSHRDLGGYKRLGLPVRFVDGPDRIEVTLGKNTQAGEGFFVSVTPEDNAIEVDRVAIINLKDDVVLLDGELCEDGLVNEPVGLFRVDEFNQTLEGHDFLPVKLFYGGEECDPSRLEEIVTREFLPEVATLAGDSSIRERWESTRDRYDLCPVTRSLAQRFLRWDQCIAEPASHRIGRPLPTSRPEECQAFISFKSEAAGLAQLLYEHLSHHGLKAFCSSTTLPHIGETDYCRAIDCALETASVLIVVATRPEHFSSDWLEYEWRSFLNEVISKRKPGGQLISLTGGLKPEELPYALRQREMIPFDLASPGEALDQAVHFALSALRPQKGSGNVEVGP